MTYVNELIKITELDKKKHKAAQHIRGRIFPFFTRNPERVKFNDPFKEIVGIIVRLTLGYSNEINDIEEKYLTNIHSHIVTNGEIKPNEIDTLFSFDFADINSPSMLKYFPIKDLKSAEVKGKVLLAEYLVELFRLKDNKEWIDYVTQTQKTLTLYDYVVSNNLPEIEELKGKKEKFHFFEQEKVVELFTRDLSTLMLNQSFFMSNIDLLFSYYMFNYIVQQSFLIDRVDRENFEMWFTFENERVSKGRAAYRKGYKLILDKAKEFLTNVDTLDYLNVLIGHEQFYSLKEILSSEKIITLLLPRLKRYNQVFSNVLSVSYISDDNIIVQIDQLKTNLKQALGKEITSRYSMTFKEFSNLGFIRSRGRLGYVFYASQELLLMFVGIIVGKKEKMLLRDFFYDLEDRGLRFDTQSRREIVGYFEKINILEKLSDSGDAQYVKSIL